MNIFAKTKKGLTLIEILIYSAMLCAFISLISVFVWDISSLSIKSDSQAEVTDNAVIATNEIGRSIRNAKAVVSPAPGNSAQSLVLSMPNGGQITFDLDQGRLRMQNSTSERINLDIVLVIDVSGSMIGAPLTSEKIAANSFIDHLDSQYDQIGLVSFSSTGTLRQSLTTDFVSAKTAVNNLTASGTTNYQDGILDATTELNSVRHRPAAIKVMVFMSDGMPNVCNGYGCNPTNSAKAAADAAKAASIEIYTIGLTQNIAPSQIAAARAILQYIASSSGGTTDHYFEAPTDSDLENIYNQIAFLLTETGSRNITSSTVLGDLGSLNFTNTSLPNTPGSVRFQIEISRVNPQGTTEFKSNIKIDDTISIRANQ